MSSPLSAERQAPMIAAIYARKSTDQHGVSDDAKSVTRQIDHANAYAAQKGWTVVDAFIYPDDGISGAEFLNRPAFQRLIQALTPAPPFQVLIMSEDSRLGREAIESTYWLKQILMAGVHVFFYLEDREVILDNPEDKVLASMRGYAADKEREMARQRTKDALLRRAKAGYVPGGRSFGVDNVEVRTPDGRRDHVAHRINPTEAAVVLRAFEWYAQGYGFRAVAHRLNDEGVPSPRTRTGRPRGWSASTVRDLLHRELYRGVLVWNRTRKRDAWGRREARRAQRRRPEPEWVRVERPDLRIVPEALWQTVQERLTTARAAYLRDQQGRLWGRPPNGTAAKYLLTGMAVCGRCDGALTVRTRSHGRQRVAFYRCLTNVQRGKAICANTAEMRLTDADRVVLQVVEADLLRLEVLTAAIEEAVAQLRSDTGAVVAQRETLQRHGQQIENELRRLADAVATAGGDVPTLVQAVKDREAQRLQLHRQLAQLDGLTQVAQLELPRLQRDLHARLTDWQGLLGRQPVQARQMLAKLLDGRLVFTPTEDGTVYEFEGKGRVEPVLAGVVGEVATGGPAKAGGSPWRFEPVLSPEGTGRIDLGVVGVPEEARGRAARPSDSWTDSDAGSAFDSGMIGHDKLAARPVSADSVNFIHSGRQVADGSRAPMTRGSILQIRLRLGCVSCQVVPRFAGPRSRSIRYLAPTMTTSGSSARCSAGERFPSDSRTYRTVT